MENNYSGEITVTSNLFIKLADDGFLKFTGLDMNASAASVFAEEDVSVIKNAFKKTSGGDYSVMLSLRRSDGVFCACLASFHVFFEGCEMLLRIKALLRRAQIVSERKITVGDAVLDYDSMTVSRKEEAIALPQKEFQLLYMMLSYPGKIFTRIQLMDEIWGPECETGWETVTVHIGRLRKRFENWNEFSIESVRGLGYRAVKNV